MTIHALREKPADGLARALVEFETRFTYPLGPGRSFRICHGEDYPRFYRAMGDATCFVAEQAGRVAGTLSVAIRALIMPDGVVRQAAYIGDLKRDPTGGNSVTFLRLAQSADAWARPLATCAYGVVMDGTRVSPTQYTGRIGIPSFLAVGKILVLRFNTDVEEGGSSGIADAVAGAECHATLTRGRCYSEGGNPAERSAIAPVWLMGPAGEACGRLEDTRRAKRLIDSEGSEMQSAHLACFAWRTPEAGVNLIHSARRHARRLGFPALFVAVPEQDMSVLECALGSIDKVIAPATIYGVRLPHGAAWNINSSEI